MNEISTLLDSIGLDLVPDLAADYFPETMTIVEDKIVKDDGGADMKIREDTAFSSIPCIYKPMGGSKFAANDQVTAKTRYSVKYATHTSAGAVIPRDSSQRFRVVSRNDQPELVFRVLSIKNILGVLYEATCEIED